MNLAFVVRDNLRQRRSIERVYMEAIQHARHRIDLVTPYFYPDRHFRYALANAAERGVKVRLLLQGKIDYRIAGVAARVLYDELLAKGVQIFEYTPAYLHAKMAVVDDEWATLGSSNIDPLSLLLNLEANVVVCDAPFARRVAERARDRDGRVQPRDGAALCQGLAGGAAPHLRGHGGALVPAHGRHQWPLLILARASASRGSTPKRLGPCVPGTHAGHQRCSAPASRRRHRSGSAPTSRREVEVVQALGRHARCSGHGEQPR